MRRVARLTLEGDVQNSLDKKQSEANRKREEGSLAIGDEWHKARQTTTLGKVMEVLRSMAGERERCMYCLDSHGTDIEHFWPKTPFPERMFLWPNLLLCCAECGRLKGDRFPLAGEEPLLIDPTADEPWQYLDFDPLTGNVVARFDPEANDWLAKGLETVEVLQLDRREALARGYRRTYRRLSDLVERHLKDGVPTGNELADALRDIDDHGLLAWCLLWGGRNLPPFRRLRDEEPDVWAGCVSAAREPQGTG